MRTLEENDSADNWREITAEEKEKIEAEQKAKAKTIRKEMNNG